MAIWQDLVDQHGFAARYASVRRFVVTLRGQRTPDAHPVIVTAPGEEGQVDYGEGPMVRHPVTRKYRRTRLFVLTLGYSRKSVRLLTFESSARRWADLHEEAFRRLGCAVRVVVLDNLKEGVLTPYTQIRMAALEELLKRRIVTEDEIEEADRRATERWRNGLMIDSLLDPDLATLLEEMRRRMQGEEPA